MARRFDVLCVGLQVIDLLVTGADCGVFDRETTNVENIELLLGGDALNQAITLSALGARTGLMGAVGSDPLGDVLLNRLAAHPITVLDRRIDAKTGISVVLCRPDGERHFVLQTGHNERFCYEHIDEQAVRDAGIVSIGSCMGMKAMDVADTLRLLELAASAGATTAMDFKITRAEYDMPKVHECIRRADYLLPSKDDAATLTGEKRDPKRMAEGMRDLGARNVILKLGERGCYVAADGVEMQSLPARAAAWTPPVRATASWRPSSTASAGAGTLKPARALPMRRAPSPWSRGAQTARCAARRRCACAWRRCAEHR